MTSELRKTRELDAALFAKRLRELRLASGATLEGLGLLCGLGFSHIARYEAAGREPSWSIVCALARALGVSVADFQAQPGESPDDRPREKPKKGRVKK